LRNFKNCSVERMSEGRLFHTVGAAREKEWLVMSIYWRLNSFVQSRLRCANWKLGQDKTRQDSVHTAFRDWTKLFRNFQPPPTVLTCRQFSSHCGRRQDKTVLSCWCRRCELGIELHMCCIIVTRWGGPGKIEA